MHTSRITRRSNRVLSAFIFLSLGIFVSVISSASPEEGNSEKPDKKTDESAQKTDEPKRSGDAKQDSGKNSGDIPVDPTEPSPRLRAAMKGPQKPPPPPAAPKVPDILLKGVIQAENKPIAAMLELDGKNLYTVREDSKITVRTGDGKSLTLVIKKISADGVDIEIPELKQTLTSR